MASLQSPKLPFFAVKIRYLSWPSYKDISIVLASSSKENTHVPEVFPISSLSLSRKCCGSLVLSHMPTPPWRPNCLCHTSLATLCQHAYPWCLQCSWQWNYKKSWIQEIVQDIGPENNEEPTMNPSSSGFWIIPAFHQTHISGIIFFFNWMNYLKCFLQ